MPPKANTKKKTVASTTTNAPAKRTKAASAKPVNNKPNASSKRAAADSIEPRSKRHKTESVPKTTAPTKSVNIWDKKKASAGPAFSNKFPGSKYKVLVFGDGSAGELGLGSVKGAIDVKAPKPNTNLDGVVALAAGGMHAAALSADGKVLTWGVNDLCALGRDTAWEGGTRDIDADSDADSDDDPGLNPREATPTAIPADKFPKGTSFVQLAAGDSATFVLTTEGLVYGWGTFRDNNGPYGFTYDTQTKHIVKTQKDPMQIPGLQNVTQIAAGADFALALDASGHVFAWGTGQQGQTGHRPPGRFHDPGEILLPTPVLLPMRTKFRSIHTGSNHAFAINDKGDVYSWGLNNFGQAGVKAGAGKEQATLEVPQKAAALCGRDMRSIAGGGHHSVGLTGTGECLVWGRVDGGQLGLDIATLPKDDANQVVLDERERPRILLAPTALPLGAQVSHVASGTDHSFAVTVEGRVFSWGFNVNYQCGQGTSDDILVAKQMMGKFVREEKVTWAGAGGQYSILAAPA